VEFARGTDPRAITGTVRATMKRKHNNGRMGEERRGGARGSRGKKGKKKGKGTTKHKAEAQASRHKRSYGKRKEKKKKQKESARKTGWRGMREKRQSQRREDCGS